MEDIKEKVEFWAFVELFGHQRLAGKITEATIGGCPLIRIDVPEVDGAKAFTRFLGNGAIYGITPVSEELAKILVKQFQLAPINVYVPEIQLLQEKSPDPAPDPDDYEDLEQKMKARQL